MNRREFLYAGTTAGTGSLLSAATPLRVAAFRADATPPLGAPLIWITPAARVTDPLLAKGILFEHGGQRFAVCAIDWCGISGSWHALLRHRIASAIGTTPDRVSVHVVHQHTAPYVCGDAVALVEKMPDPPLLYPRREFEEMAGRIADAASRATAELKAVDHIGLSEVTVERVASARRLLDASGSKVAAVRYSGSGKSPEMAAAPEGEIDRHLKSIVFLAGRTPVARLHFYATHPQTFCCEGTVTSDFVGSARERFEKEEGIPQIYLTGCSGDITVGKYNDGSEQARSELSDRMLKAFRLTTKPERVERAANFTWNRVPLHLPKRKDDDPWLVAHRKKMAAPDAAGQDVYRSGVSVAYQTRDTPLDVGSFGIGPALTVLLPGEPFLTFQRFSQQLLPDRFVTVAGYGDMGPGYLCTDVAYDQGGYEPGAANVAPGTEGALKAAIRAAMDSES